MTRIVKIQVAELDRLLEIKVAQLAKIKQQIKSNLKIELPDTLRGKLTKVSTTLTVFYVPNKFRTGTLAQYIEHGITQNGITTLIFLFQKLRSELKTQCPKPNEVQKIINNFTNKYIAKIFTNRDENILTDTEKRILLHIILNLSSPDNETMTELVKSKVAELEKLVKSKVVELEKIKQQIESKVEIELPISLQGKITETTITFNNCIELYVPKKAKMVTLEQHNNQGITLKGITTLISLFKNSNPELKAQATTRNDMESIINGFHSKCIRGKLTDTEQAMFYRIILNLSLAWNTNSPQQAKSVYQPPSTYVTNTKQERTKTDNKCVII